MSLDPQNDPRPGDLEYTLLRKILQRLSNLSTGGGGGVTQAYVDAQDALTLASANATSAAGDATTLASANAHSDANDALHVLKAGDTMTGTLNITPAVDTSALTVSAFSLDGTNAQSMVDLSGTWNTSGAPTGLKFNVTDTASAAASLLFDFQHSGTSFFNLRKDGRLVLGGRLSIASTIGANILGMTYTDATGNSAPSLITVSRNTSGTPAAGLGTLFDWNIDSSTTINRLAVRLTADWTDATDATRTSEFKVTTVTNGATVSNGTFTLGSLRMGNGTAAAPVFTAINFIDTGMYFPGTGTGALTGGGAQVFSWVVGGVTIPTAKTLSIQSGANQRAGNLTLVAGTKTVANTTVTANTIVILTKKTDGGTLSPDITYTVSAATSFTVTSASALDTSTFSYLLIEVP